MLLMKNSAHSFHLRLLEPNNINDDNNNPVPLSLCVFSSEKCFWHEVINSLCDLRTVIAFFSPFSLQID